MSRRHAVVSFPNGTRSLAEIATNRAMHSRIGPSEEARLLYVEQSGLAGRLATGESELVVYDVGLGLGANAVMALETWSSAIAAGTRRRGLRLLSFENDTDGLATALEEIASFPLLAPHEGRLRELLETGRVARDGFDWRLITGDFFDHLGDAPPAELVFYDFYAPESCPGLWDTRAFARLRDCLQPRGLLFTYASATWVRLAMLQAGLFVGSGRATSEKGETTAAARSLEELDRPLDAAWLERKLSRATKLLPPGLRGNAAVEAALRTEVRAHPQFMGG